MKTSEKIRDKSEKKTAKIEKAVLKAAKKYAAAEEKLIKLGAGRLISRSGGPRAPMTLADALVTCAIAAVIPLKLRFEEDAAVFSAFAYRLSVSRDENGLNLNFRKSDLGAKEIAGVYQALVAGE